MERFNEQEKEALEFVYDLCQDYLSKSYSPGEWPELDNTTLTLAAMMDKSSEEDEILQELLDYYERG